jgi:hypothetical protein
LYGEITGRRQLRLAVAVGFGVCKLAVDPLVHPVTSRIATELSTAFFGMGIAGKTTGRDFGFGA